MRLVRATYVNFCQHEIREVEFHPGLNCIKGPNGSGKSNLLTGVVGALTNDFSRNDGIKNDNIRELIPPKELAGVVVTVEHGGTLATVERWLRTTKDHPFAHRLQLADQEWTRDAEVRRELQRFLGVTDKLLLDYVFVNQWEIFNFLSATESERAKTFQQLFGTVEAEAIYNLLGDTRVDVPAPRVDGEVVRRRLAQYQQEITLLNSQLDALPVVADDWSMATDPRYQVVINFRRKKELEVEVESLRKNYKQLTERVQNLAQRNDVNDKVVESVAGKVEEHKTTAAAAQEALQAWAAFHTAERTRKEVCANLVYMEQERKTRLAPEPVTDYLTSGGEEFQKSRHWQSRLDHINRVIKTFDPQTGVSECPTCGTTARLIQGGFMTLGVEARVLQHSLDTFNDRWNRSRAYDQQMRAYRDWDATSQGWVHHYQQQLDKLADITQPDQDEHTLHAAVAEQAIQEKELLRLRQEQATLHNTKAQAEGQQLAVLAQWRAREADLDDLAVTAEDVLAAEQSLAATAAAFKTRSELQACLAVLQRGVTDDGSLLQQFEEDCKQANRARQLAGHLEEVRAVFHHSNLPKVVAQHYLETMEDEVNTVLEQFDAPFVVEVSEDQKFIVRFRSGIRLPAGRLSGGQKVVFAIAFRVVVNSIFAKDLGLLCLDEPTAGLDAHNMACLEVALGRLRELSQARGLQVVLVTHERVLDNLFDRVIDLGAGGNGT